MMQLPKTLEELNSYPYPFQERRAGTVYTIYILMFCFLALSFILG